MPGLSSSEAASPLKKNDGGARCLAMDVGPYPRGDPGPSRLRVKRDAGVDTRDKEAVCFGGADQEQWRQVRDRDLTRRVLSRSRYRRG